MIMIIIVIVAIVIVILVIVIVTVIVTVTVTVIVTVVTITTILYTPEAAAAPLEGRVRRPRAPRRAAGPQGAPHFFSLHILVISIHSIHTYIYIYTYIHIIVYIVCMYGWIHSIHIYIYIYIIHTSSYFFSLNSIHRDYFGNN